MGQAGTKIKKSFLTGNEIILRAALKAGADFYAGYPITPTTEILTGWATEASKNDKLKFLQTEDETSAGFTVIGGVLSGRKAWTATGGPGNILMQDPMSMAEAMRLPTVCYIGQRGGPSTGTVIYSQQELTLTRFGGNGEGLRIVYSPSNLQELYDYTIKAFNAAWTYRFPTFILGDGYLGKTLGSVREHDDFEVVKPERFVQGEKQVNLRNCFSIEDELNASLEKDIQEFARVSKKIVESEEVFTKDAKILIFAHGGVGAAAKIAVQSLRSKGIKVGLFRPITIRPFPVEATLRSVNGVEKILIAESSYGHFGRIVREVLYGVTDAPAFRLYKPALAITPEEIEEMVLKIMKGKL